MTEDSFIMITTYIGSGITDVKFLDQRINILKYSTIPSLTSQTCKNFIWCVYLDELNNPKDKLDEIVKLLESYNNSIKIHICKYKPILSDGSLCVDNRARSCSSKRYELYLDSVKYCKEKGYFKSTKYISHLMLDDDDPILKGHIKWINDKIKEFENNKPTIVINKNQYIFYLDHLSLMNVESNKAMKGSCFIFYPIELDQTINFHPYSIIETIESNYEYRDRYGIDCRVVSDDPTWIYFRHQLSTSAYSKEFIVNKKKEIIEGYQKIVNKLEFYNSRLLEKLINSLKSEHRSSEIVSWKSFRNAEKKRIMMIVSDLNVYESALKLANFLKNNFIIRLIGLDVNGKNNKFIQQYPTFFNKNAFFWNKEGDEKWIMINVTKFNPDYTYFFGKIEDFDRLHRFLKTNKYSYDVVNIKDKLHTILGKSIRNITNWKKNELMDIYYRLGDRLLQ